MIGGITWAQTTFTENAAAHNLNLGLSKDGGHAWCDFDRDGDLDVLVLEASNSAKSFLMQNNGGNFTNVQSTLAPGMLGDAAERQAVWGDLNNDGRPDFMINSHGGGGGTTVAFQIFLQNSNGTFGDGAGGFNPITIGRNSNADIRINPINAEGAGFFDFEGDGDLDIFFDSHNYGIELVQNNFIDHVTHTIVNPPAVNLFTHITPGNGSGVVEYGLNQFATDGDYGTAADVDDDGWVDIFMRKRNENDLFLNQGGMFTSGADLGQASNSNKGANGLWDLDNDGDLDAVWTENGLTQIYRNDGPGIWTALGSVTFPGLPQPNNVNNGNSSARIDALAGGDIDNDGDIDILFVGNSRSYLFINQLNSPTPAPGVIGSGTAMTFSLDAQTFNSNNGEGSTMVDFDDDGDLDIYININNGPNELYVNNLPAANRNNHLLIDVTEDRDASGNTGGYAGRIAIGTNVILKDCAGNIISGLRQVNGVYGHGTQIPEEVHFGLPLGEGETYTVEVHYPQYYDSATGTTTRLVATAIAEPSTIPGTNHYVLTTTDVETIENPNAPDAVDDSVTVPFGNTVSIQINLFNNDSEPDGDNFFIESIVQPSVGTVVIDDADNGLVTYTYSAGTPFPGVSFDYTISDAMFITCAAQGKSDTATVNIYEPCADPSGLDTDGDGINDVCDYDDDNDGIPDFEEQLCSTTNPGSLGTPTTVQGGTAVDEVYTDFGGLWYSTNSAINSVQPNLSHNVIAFGSGGNLYSTGVVNNNMLDTDSDGRYDAVDTNGDGNGDITSSEQLWQAFRPSAAITGKVALEGSNNDGSTAAPLGSTVVSNLATDPLNPLLTNGARGLDLGTGIANINDAWFFNISTIELGAIGDGQPDILFTQIALVTSAVSHKIAFFDVAGNPVGNEVEITSNAGGALEFVIANQRTDAYQADGTPWQSNEIKPMRMATVELSEFGLNATNFANVALMRLTMSANADTAFLAYNTDSFGDFCSDLDTDADGIPDRVDLDSDNDGIYDVVEAGHDLVHTNGVLIGAVGSDGILDALQSNPNNQSTNYIIKDTDGDGFFDVVDLDSDADGCNDVIEAGFTDGDGDGELASAPVTVDGNGLVTSGIDGYTTPEDSNANSVFDFQEFSATPTIDNQPQDVMICDACTGTFMVSTSQADTYQWQLFNGTIWVDLTDTGIYTGTTTHTLIITNPPQSENGNQYRVLVSNSINNCVALTSNTATLTVGVRTVITNRRITYRAKPN